MALYVSSQSAYAKWLTEEEKDNLILNGDVLFSNSRNEIISNIEFQKLEVWFRLDGEIYYCISSTAYDGLMLTNCNDSRCENE